MSLDELIGEHAGAAPMGERAPSVSTRPEGPRRRAHCEIWAEKRDGTKITIGSASAVKR